MTPEICDSSLLASEGSQSLCVKAGGLADVSALLLDSLTKAGAEVHVTLPNFRSFIEPSPKNATGHTSGILNSLPDNRSPKHDPSSHRRELYRSVSPATWTSTNNP